MSFEGVQAAAPELAVRSQPPVHLGKRLGAQPIPAALPLRAHAHEARVAQDAHLPARRLGEDVEGEVKNGIPEGWALFLSKSQWKAPNPLACGTIGAMRAATPFTVAVIASLTAAAAAATAAPGDPRITADPATVDSDRIQTVRGRNWPVIEFCSRTIRVSVRSPQNAAPIAQRRVSDSGRFRFRWIPQNKNIGPGPWRLVARMRCESGKDGSTVFVRASTPIRIRP